MPLSKKQKRIARVSAPFNKITGADFRKLKRKKKSQKEKEKVPLINHVTIQNLL